MATSGTLPSLESSSPDNDGPTVVVIAYILLVLTALTVIGRVVSTLSRRGALERDDTCLVLATVIAIAQTVVTERAVDMGLGRFMNKLSASHIDFYYKYMYASQILSILTMALTKFSVILIVQRIRGDRSMVKPCLYTGIGVLLWTVFSVFALLFQCGAVHPWVYTPQRCAGDVWYAVIVLNIISDGVLAFFFAPTLWKLQTSRTQRLKVMSLFAVRLVVCAAGIIQLAFLPSALNSNDQTRSRVNVTIVNQLVVNLSILTAAVPSLYRAVADMHTNFGLQLAEGHMEMYNSASKAGGSSNVKTAKTTTKAFSRNQSNNRSQIGGGEEKVSSTDSEEHLRHMDEGRTTGKVEHDANFNAETGSHASDGSEQMIIRQTRAWDVRYEQD